MNSCIVESYDAPTHSLKTTIVNAAVDVTVSAITDSVAIADVSGNKATTTLVGGKRGLDVNIIDITLDKANDSIAVEGYEQSKRIDEASSTVTYFGYAVVGTTDAASAWKIKRVTISGTVTLFEYANGNINYTNIWNNRASLSYS
jgi:hypothetical protein